MNTVVFVHGTGGREKTVTVTVKQIEKELKKRDPSVNLVNAYWGGDWGTQLQAGGASIPDYETTRGDRDHDPSPEELTDEDFQIVLWDMLLQDSLFELRLLEQIGGMQGKQAQDEDEEEAPPNVLPSGEAMLQRARLLTPLDDASDPYLQKLNLLLIQAGILTVFPEARDYVVRSRTCENAVRNADELPEARAALARAVVAEAMRRTTRSKIPPAIWDSTLIRDALVTQLDLSLQDGLRGIPRGAAFDWMKHQLVGLAGNVGSRIGTWYIRNHRGGVTDKAFGFPGDILLYQARGKAIRDAVEAEVAKAGGPVVLLGHSLGGIACVDLLVEKPLPAVQHLITVGSQAPFLYEMNALASMPFEKNKKPYQRLPEHFPKWTNIYDKRDFLSYVGGKLFGSRVLDVEARNGRAFPDAHGAYWENPDVYDTIAQRLA